MSPPNATGGSGDTPVQKLFPRQSSWERQVPPIPGSVASTLSEGSSVAGNYSASRHSVNELSMWLLKRRGAKPEAGAVARTVAGSCVQSMCWCRRFFHVGSGKLSYWRTDDAASAQGKALGVFLVSEIDEVVSRGREILIHFAATQRSGGRARESLCLLALSADAAGAWAAAVCAAASVALRHVMALPLEWDITAMLQKGCGTDGTRLVAKIPLSAESVQAVQRLVDHAYIAKRTKDRDGFEMPLRLEVAEVVNKVQNTATWGAYSKTRAAIAQRSRSLRPLTPDIRTTSHEDPLIAALGDLDDQVAEHWLFHGTSSQAVRGITDTDFKLDLAGSHRGTLYGRGLYLAECSSKADEYAKPESDGLCRMLLCRAVLGRTFVEVAKRPKDTELLEVTCRSDIEGSQYDSLCGDRLKAVGTYREFVVYNSGQVYPAYIIVYRRAAQASFLRAIGEAAEAVSSDAAGEQEHTKLEQLVTHAACLAKRHPDSQTTYRILLLLSTHGAVIGPSLAASLQNRVGHGRRAVVRVLGLLGEHLSSGTVQGETHRSESNGLLTKVAQSAVPALIYCLDDSDARVRQASAEALRLFGSRASGAASALVEAVRDRAAAVRAAAATALGRLGGNGAPLEALVHCLTDESPAPRRAAAESLGVLCSRTGAWEAEPSTVPSLARALEDPDAQVRMAAASALIKAGPRGAAGGALQPLMRCLDDEHEGVREQASRALGEMGAAAIEAETLLLNRLHDGHAPVRSAAATALGLLGQRTSPVMQLKRCLGDTNNEVRKAAAAALGNLREHAAAAVPALGRRLVDNDEEVRTIAALALGQLGRHAVRALPALTERIKDPDVGVRRAATTALVRMGPYAAKAAPALKELLNDPNLLVREAAGMVLKQIANSACRGERKHSVKGDELGPGAGGAGSEDDRSVDSRSGSKEGSPFRSSDHDYDEEEGNSSSS